MRVPLSWLADYVDVPLTPEQLAERLTLLGMEVQGIERWGADWRNVLTGELLEVAKHPLADRLSLTKVRVGTEVLEIVCGATNIAPGQRVPVALPGAVLPGNRAIERTEKMGVVSNGMLCSGDELRLTADGDGILILPDDTPLGVPMVDLYGDIVLDIDVKPNRGDALSLVGLAREVSAITGSPIRFPATSPEDRPGPSATERLGVEVREPGLCPRFVGRWVGDIAVGSSPDRVQMRLLAAGMRPVNNVVDATNYVMLELGKPIHAFDAATVAPDAAGRAGLVVRLASPGERLETLDHVERELDEDTLLIADARGPLAIAGVMGGSASEVSAATHGVILESAIFDPVSIRRTAFRHALRSEASLRFERGQEPRLARIGADRAADLVVAWGGGRAALGRVDTAPDEAGSAHVAFRPARVNRLLGTGFSAAEQAALLARVGITVDDAPPGTQVSIAVGERSLAVASGRGALLASVPSWRRDLQVEADVAEEIARVCGYDAVPTKTPDTPMPHFRPDPLERRDAVRRALAAAGLTEVLTPALVAESAAAHIEWPIGAADGVPGEEAVEGRPVRLRNPLSERHAVLRSGVVGSLLDVLSVNERHGRGDVAVFEIGKGYAVARDGQPAEWWRLAFLLAGSACRPAWDLPGRAWSLEDGKAVVGLVARALGAPEAVFTAHRDGAPLHPGRAARVAAGDVVGGLVGEVHPAVLAAWDLRTERVVVGEFAVAGLAAGQLPVVRLSTTGRRLEVERDLAVVVTEETAAGDVAATLRDAGGPWMQAPVLFDVYRGAPLVAGEKSLAWRIGLRAGEGALEEGEADAVIGRLVEAVAARHGGRLRA